MNIQVRTEASSDDAILRYDGEHVLDLIVPHDIPIPAHELMSPWRGYRVHKIVDKYFVFLFASQTQTGAVI